MSFIDNLKNLFGSFFGEKIVQSATDVATDTLGAVEVAIPDVVNTVSESIQNVTPDVLDDNVQAVAEVVTEHATTATDAVQDMMGDTTAK
jgi:hypothetical protein